MTIWDWELRADVDGYQTYVNTITWEVDVVDSYWNE